MFSYKENYLHVTIASFPLVVHFFLPLTTPWQMYSSTLSNDRRQIIMADALKMFRGTATAAHVEGGGSVDWYGL
jgi:hypothetical protein